VATADRDDSGAAVVEFVLVSVLLTTLFLGVLQVGLALFVRNTLVACAQDGARLAANRDRTLLDGEERAQRCAQSALPMASRRSVSSSVVFMGSRPVAEVRLTTRLPLIGPFGPRSLAVYGHALLEDR
jgi:Flp pilus assembly protein TadG